MFESHQAPRTAFRPEEIRVVYWSKKPEYCKLSVRQSRS